MPYLVLTDGTTTVNFAVTGNYPLKAGGYIPNISSVILDEAVQERGLHYSVTDEIRCEVKGSGAADAFANLQTLKALLLQAKRWYNGERNLAAVVLKYSPDGATVSTSGNPLNMVVYGPVEERDVVLASKIEEVNYNFVFSEVVIRIRRQGEMLGPKPTTGSGTTERITAGPTAENTVLKDLTLTGTAPVGRYPVAYYCELTGVGSVDHSGVILLARKNGSDNNIAVGSGGGLSPSAPFTDQNDAGNLPRHGTNVLRFTPTDTAIQTTPTFVSVSKFSRASCVVSLRNNDATKTYKIRAQFVPSTTFTTTVYSPWEVVDGSTVNPRHILLAAVGLLLNVTYSLKLQIQASATGSTLDVNYVATMNDGDPFSQAIMGELIGSSTVVRSPMIADDLDVVALSGAISANPPGHTLESVGTQVMIPTFKALRPLYGIGNTMQVLTCLHGPTRWAPRNIALSAVAAIEHHLYRRLTYLTPQ